MTANGHGCTVPVLALGQEERLERFDLILLGDDVSRTAESNKLGVTDMFPFYPFLGHPVIHFHCAPAHSAEL